VKICCACPETKQPRDDCIVRNGEEACKALVDAHNDCLRKMGFNV
jgi:cytochrome c oxidase assembly protein subunit 17